MTEERELVKIVIDSQMEEDGIGGEGLWAKSLGNDLYELDNSPWHTLAINYRDVVRAVSPSEDKKPVFLEVVNRGGHRTIQMFVLPDGKAHQDEVLARVKVLGATYEGADATLYAIDLAPEVDFDVIANYLLVCEDHGWVDCRWAPQPQPHGTGDLLN